jgi:hypothetical protein
VTDASKLAARHCARPGTIHLREAERTMNHRHLTLIALSLAPLLAAGQAPPAEETKLEFPQQQNAGDMLFACASSRLSRVGRERRRYCAGFVSGVEEAVRLMQMDGPTQVPTSTRICTPENISAGELAEAFIHYGANHEGELPDPAALVVLHALQSAYPCSER